MNIFKVKGSINYKALLISIILTGAAGLLGSFLGMGSNTFYFTLKKPVFAPPWVLFPIICALLYFLMALAAYRIYSQRRHGAFINKALFLYIIQLFLNFLWTIIFFRFNLYGLAFLELLLLIVFFLLTIFEFLKIDKLSGILMLPCLLWISFSGVINYVIWLLNEA